MSVLDDIIERHAGEHERGECSFPCDMIILFDMLTPKKLGDAERAVRAELRRLSPESNLWWADSPEGHAAALRKELSDWIDAAHGARRQGGGDPLAAGRQPEGRPRRREVGPRARVRHADHVEVGAGVEHAFVAGNHQPGGSRARVIAGWIRNVSREIGDAGRA